MDINRLGHSGLRVPALGFGTATFGGGNDFFKAWGSTANDLKPAYPVWHQRGVPMLNERAGRP